MQYQTTHKAIPQSNRYRITPDGKILDLIKNKYKPHSKMGNGSYCTTLVDNENRYHTYLLTTLMWSVFKDEVPDRGSVIVPIDGNKANLHIDNLKVISRKELMKEKNGRSRYKMAKCQACGVEALKSPRFIYHMRHCKGGMSKMLQRKLNQNEQ